jgi:very-short-patch-repair endonuclease
VEGGNPNRFRTANNKVLKEIIEGLAAARYRSLAIQEILADECVRRADSLTPREFADIAIAFAEVRAGDSTFWSTFASHVEKNWESYHREHQLFSLWSLVVMAPEKVPSRFNASILRDHPPTRVLHKVTQALIAFGRYTPKPDDPAYRFLVKSLGPFKQHAHERKFMLELPGKIGVPAHTIFPQVVVGGFETDLIVDFGHRRLIIELDGGSHFLGGPDGGILRGKDEFQDRVFIRLGYKIFHFPTSFKDRNEHYRSLNTLVNTLKQQARAANVPIAYYLEKLTPKDRGKA